MAAQAWKVYQSTRKYIGNGSINLGATVFRCTLHTSASNFADETLSVYGSLNNEVTEANGYSSSGKALTNEVWTTGTSAQQIKFDTDDVFWSANGGSIANIKAAVIWLSGASAGGRKLLCYASLTSSQFSLAAGNRLTIQMNASGVLTLSGA